MIIYRVPACTVFILQASIGRIWCRLEENCKAELRSNRHKQYRLPRRLRRPSQLKRHRRHRCNALYTRFVSFTVDLSINKVWRSLEILISSCSSAGRMVLVYQRCISQHFVRQHLGINPEGFSSYRSKFPPNLIYPLWVHLLSSLLAS